MPQPDDFDSFVDDFLKTGERNSDESLASNTGLADEYADKKRHYSRVMLSTTSTIPGKKATASKGLVSGRIVKGQGVWRNFKMLMGSDAFGKRSEALESEFNVMEQECFRQLKIAAARKGANAVVGVSLQFGETSGEADLFYAVVTGTAVLVE